MQKDKSKIFSRIGNSLGGLIKKLRSLKKKWIVLFVLIVIIGASTGAYFAFVNKPTQTKEKELKASEKIEKIYTSAGPNATSEQIKSSVKELEKQAETTDSIVDKQNYYTTIVDMSANSGDFEAAIESANKSEELNPTAFTAEVLAAVYMQKGDYVNAAKYYQIAADRSEKSTDPSAQSPYNDYMALKKAAEEQIK